MALQLRYQVELNDYTFPYAYARIGNCEVQRHYRMDLYAGRAARELGREPLESFPLELTDAEAARLRQDTLSSLYRILKDRPEYNGLAEV